MKSEYLILLALVVCAAGQEECSNFNNEYPCKDNDMHDWPSDWDQRSFQTPPRGDVHYKESYQDMHLIVGYLQTRYSADKSTATLTFYTRVNEKELPSDYRIMYTFGEIESSSNTLSISKAKSYPNGMKVSCKVISDSAAKIVATLELEDAYFLWDTNPVNQLPNYENGQKGAVVEFFGWPYGDIKEECDFLSTAGYMALKVFPPQEAIFTFETVENGELNPWYFLYQPVSYRMHSRMGTKTQFREMIQYCRSKNVRVYADAVVNHMTGNGNDMYWDHRNPQGESCVHWSNKNGADGSPWWTVGWQYENNPYTGLRPGLEFPSVPYIATDFHCERPCNAWDNPIVLNYGWLTGLTDLNTEKEYVQQRIADYITDLLSVGVSGVRIDAAKHIKPQSLSEIFKRLKDNLGGGELPDDFIAYLEVLFGGEKFLLFCDDNDYNYGPSFEAKMSKVGLSKNDIEKIKIWGSDFPKEHPICGKWVISSTRMIAQYDCHDDQNPGSSSREMADKGSVYIRERNAQKHRDFNKLLFTRTDGEWKIRMVLTSYSFMENGGAGFPDGNSDCSKCTGKQCKENCSKSVPYQKAYNPASTGYDTGSKDNWKEGSYTRVHRDMEVINAMRGWMGLNPLSFDELYGEEMKKAKILKKTRAKKFIVN